MSKKDFAIIGSRLLAIYAFIHFLPSFTTVLAIFQMDYYSQETVFFLIAYIISFFLLGLITVIIWKTLPKLILKGTEEETSEQQSTYVNIQYTAFSIAGLIVLIDGLPTLVAAFFNMYALANTYNQPIPLSNKTHAIAQVFKVIIGFWLLFGYRGILEFIRHLRNCRK